MKKISIVLLFSTFSVMGIGQMDVPPVGGNPRASITEEVGITSITVKYSRPDVAGREGKIWGTLVTPGFSTNSFITNRPTAPWRAGANENTTITFEHDVKLEGKALKAGTYGIFMAVWPDSVMLILSNQSDAWGSFYYEEKNDALRTIIKPQMNDKSVEWLKYEFIDHKEKSCTIAMLWEKLIVPFKVEVDVDQIVIARLREQVTSQRGFNSTNMVQAAQFCLNKNINLDEALTWSQRAVSGFNGQRSFVTLRNLATAYEKLNRLPAADSVMTEALGMANANQYVAYGRALITQKRTDKALDVLKTNLQKNGDVYIANLGLMFGYSAKGDYATAIKHADKAMAQATNDQAKKQIEGNIAKLKENKDIN
jgi:tetratricopeptide (TPR) repeat protein